MFDRRSSPFLYIFMKALAMKLKFEQKDKRVIFYPTITFFYCRNMNSCVISVKLLYCDFFPVRSLTVS